MILSQGRIGKSLGSNGKFRMSAIPCSHSVRANNEEKNSKDIRLVVFSEFRGDSVA